MITYFFIAPSLESNIPTFFKKSHARIKLKHRFFQKRPTCSRPPKHRLFPISHSPNTLTCRILIYSSDIVGNLGSQF